MDTTNYRFVLEGKQKNGETITAISNRNQKKHTCPACGEKGRYVRYVDKYIRDYIPVQYGRCERVNECVYHLSPYDDGYSKSVWEKEKENYNWRNSFYSKYRKPAIKPKPKPISYLKNEYLLKSLNHYHQNNFVIFLKGFFGEKAANSLIKKYFIGTANHRFRWKDYPRYMSEPGASVFWFVDEKGNIRAGKIMLYSPENGKRIKKPNNHVTWVHSKLTYKGIIKDFNLSQCLFGLHLLNQNKEMPIAVCESEKTAIISSLYFPEFIWMATGGLQWLKPEILSPLKGRKIMLWPDMNAYEKWNQISFKAHDLDVRVSSYLEEKGINLGLKTGDDLADYLLKFKPDEFRLPDGFKYETFTRSDGINCTNLINQYGYPAAWDIENAHTN